MLRLLGTTIDAVLIEADRAPRWVRVSVDERGSALEGLQGLVRGLIEPVDLGGGVVLWANEVGLCRAEAGEAGFGPNVLATRLAVAVYGSWSVIVGPCVVTGDFEGATVSLPGPWGDWIIDCPVAGFLVTVGSRLG